MILRQVFPVEERDVLDQAGAAFGLGGWRLVTECEDSVRLAVAWQARVQQDGILEWSMRSRLGTFTFL